MKTKKLQFRRVFKKLLLPNLIESQCTEKHIREIKLHIRRWEDFWGKKCPNAHKCDRSHLEMFRRHLREQEFSSRTINKHLGSIRTLLITCQRHQLISTRPTVEELTVHENMLTKSYLRDEQICQLFANVSKLRWPSKSVTGIDPKDWWRCAIVLYRTYGFRTQELLAYETNKWSLSWENISFGVESPSPASHETCEFGWLSYVPPKTRKKKATPIIIPLTMYARRALDKIGPQKSGTIFRLPKSQEGFLGQWDSWLESSGVKHKTADAKYRPSCLRKTCATYMNLHLPGLASAVCRWGASSEAKVAANHYVSNDQILRQIHSAAYPKCFADYLSG